MGIHDSNRTIVIWDKAKLGALVQINRNLDMGKSLYLESFNCCCSVAKSGPTLRPHGLQHARLPCPLPSPRVCSNSCTLSQWCHPIISSSVVPFSLLQSFPASGSFQMIQLFTSGGQSIGVSASTPVLPMNTQDWSPLGWTGWISLQSKVLSKVFSNTTVQKHHFFSAQPSLWSKLFAQFCMYISDRDQGKSKNGRHYVTGNYRQYWWKKNPYLEPLLWRTIKWKYFQSFQRS